MKRCYEHRRVISFLVFVMIIILLPSSAYAHPYDIYSGTYTGTINHTNMKFKIESSAQTSLLTSSVYNAAHGWDNVSSTVGTVGVAMAYPGMPSTGFFSVNGVVYTDGTLGETIPRNSSGNIVSLTSNWYSVSINMNTYSLAYYGASDETQAAKKTFIHEVGHALKLKHPVQNSALDAHVYDGLPWAVMNQGFPNGYNVANIVSVHDKKNLRQKWGN
ncbi:MAG: hypothetical protein J6O53_00205 [Eubacterium sp.]|nr:hypothetical protein [Eubacterium sp.]